MGFASLGSGSRGNGTLIFLGGRLFLVDCGFSLKQTEGRLARLGVSAGDIDAILVTHEHADHVNGVNALSHKYNIPVYASYGTQKNLGRSRSFYPFNGDVVFEIEGVSINPVRVPHDAREPTQFTFNYESECVGVLSDLGCFTEHVFEQFKSCGLLLLEANHDVSMLSRSAYPIRLKDRIRNDFGHLSNDQSFEALQKLIHKDLEVAIGHVSEQNNSTELLKEMFNPMKSQLKGLYYATQKEGFEWVGSRPVFRQMQIGNVS